MQPTAANSMDQLVTAVSEDLFLAVLVSLERLSGSSCEPSILTILNAVL